MNKGLSYDREHDACGIGAVVKIDGVPEYSVMDDALSIVEKLEHRAGKDASGTVGDGVGILLQICHPFFSAAAYRIHMEIGEAGDYGIGMFFLPRNDLKRTFARRLFEVIAEKEGITVIGWREVPIHPEILGAPARDCMPAIWQCFLQRPGDIPRGIDFDRRLYVVRREFEQIGMQGSHVAVDGHLVVVEHDEYVIVAVSGIIQPLKGKTSGHGSISDHRHCFLIGAGQSRRFGKSQGGRDRGGSVACSESVVRAFVSVREPA